MAKATYSTDNIGHYGLAFDYYTHFTSPIRRYPDMMVHRLLAHYLAGLESPRIRRYYERLCEHSSAMEVRAADAERASIKYKMVEFMLDKLDQEFDGHIRALPSGAFTSSWRIRNRRDGRAARHDRRFLRVRRGELRGSRARAQADVYPGRRSAHPRDAGRSATQAARFRPRGIV